MKRVYWLFLQLYPRDYRIRFAAEMSRAFESSAADSRRDGREVLIRFMLAEFGSLVTGAAAEWVAKLTTNAAVRGRGLPDPQVMRPPGVSREVWFAAAERPDELYEAQQQVDLLVGKMVHAIANHDFPGARSYSSQEREARENLRRLQSKYGIAS
ncbi:MAG TPA: hypothetical protein VKU01_13565 [Bryobacteraceae bacterium]|nr:hypothetical protein [Bryobacteraceae bacterium]